MRVHAAPSLFRRPARFGLPALLLSASALAFGGLAVLPAPVPDAPGVLVAQGAGTSTVDALTLLKQDLAPPVAAPVRPRATSAAKSAARRAATRPAAKPARSAPAKRATSRERASRSRVSTVLRVGSGYACPVAGRHSFTDTWGDARSGGRRHQGTDILAAYGTPLVAVTSGSIRTAYSRAGGISLYLRGDDGVEYFYAHNSRNTVSSGERVVAGEVIAAVGTSGNAPSGTPHVHFERHPGRSAVNPYGFLRRVC